MLLSWVREGGRSIFAWQILLCRAPGRQTSTNPPVAQRQGPQFKPMKHNIRKVQKVRDDLLAILKSNQSLSSVKCTINFLGNELAIKVAYFKANPEEKFSWPCDYQGVPLIIEEQK